ncbi:MAG TPA: hypothetical protein VNE83_07055 [Terriglobales bacterium]|nr:hypothetical protein [Terriglobales bacterium]
MSTSAVRLERRLRLAGSLIVAGLLIEAVTMAFVHPIAMMSFVFLGGGFLGAGVLVYLLTLVKLN